MPEIEDRWHKWPNEKPTGEGPYLTYSVDREPGKYGGTLDPLIDIEKYHEYPGLFDTDWEWWQRDKEDCSMYRVTHWREMPEPPEG